MPFICEEQVLQKIMQFQLSSLVIVLIPDPGVILCTFSPLNIIDEELYRFKLILTAQNADTDEIGEPNRTFNVREKGLFMGNWHE